METKICVFVDSDLLEMLKKRKDEQGVSQKRLINIAIRDYFGARIDLKDDLKAKLRVECIKQGKTLNQLVGEIVENGLKND